MGQSSIEFAGTDESYSEWRRSNECSAASRYGLLGPPRIEGRPSVAVTGAVARMLQGIVVNLGINARAWAGHEHTTERRECRDVPKRRARSNC